MAVLLDSALFTHSSKCSQCTASQPMSKKAILINSVGVNSCCSIEDIVDLTAAVNCSKSPVIFTTKLLLRKYTNLHVSVLTVLKKILA